MDKVRKWGEKMIFNNNFYKAKFIKRPNRFNAEVILNNEKIVVHVPNTGRCRELLKENAIVILREELNPTRKTKYDLIAVYKGDVLINIDSQVPNKVIQEALENKKISSLERYNNISREKTYGNSRFDFRLEDDKQNIYYLEVKGATLEENGEIKFPDAPTERGKKHILELIEIKENGMGAGILFLVQMENAKCFKPNWEMDKAFSEALKTAKDKGVDVMAYTCYVQENEIKIKEAIDVIV